MNIHFSSTRFYSYQFSNSFFFSYLYSGTRRKGPVILLIVLITTCSVGFSVHPLMGLATSSPEVMICQTCGDEGFTNAFIYCAKCSRACIHRYCLPEMPRTMHEFVFYLCERCKQTVPSQKGSTTNLAPVKQKKKRRIALLVESSVSSSESIKITPCAQKGIIIEKEATNLSQMVNKCSAKGKRTRYTENTNDHSCHASSSDSSPDIHYQPSRPVLDSVWRGSFNISRTDYKVFEGFVGHLSTRACSKVCAEASLLPSTLCLEMHPKTSLWPKSFLHSQPTDGNIGLYFFAGDETVERDFKQLVMYMVREELAMKTITKNAELLIFTSTVLPMSDWGFQGKYYLWGVFKGKSKDSVPPCKHSNAVSKSVDNHGMSMPKEGTKKVVVKSRDPRSPKSLLCE